MPHSDVRLDFNLAMEEAIGPEGLKPEEISALETTVREVHRGLAAMKEVGQIPFYHLPYEEDRVEQIVNAADQFQNSFETLVVLGIGGSALGAKTLISALGHPFLNHLPPEKRKGTGVPPGACRVFVCDTLDPDSLGALFEILDFNKTLFNVISKSGETLETMSQMKKVTQLLQERLGSQWARHLVATTDPAKGHLRQLVKEKHLHSFEIPPGVGGRFSVLSAVGLFPAAMAGLDIRELLAGARRGDLRTNQEALWMNPAYMLAVIEYLMFSKKKNILVLMPYSDTLFPLAEWYCQLWAESIGKRFSLKGEPLHTGSTPVAACGPRDQHSQLQLYMEGPKDKYILFFQIENFQSSLTLPAESSEGEAWHYLKGLSLSEILQVEAKATQEALRQEGRPSSQMLIPHRNPYAIGQLLFLLEVATAFAGGLFNVNPFDQPGVELTKKIAGGLLNKPGLEEFKEKISSRKRKEEFVI